MKKLILGFSLLAALHSPAYCAESEEPIGTVMSFSGTWTLIPKSQKSPRKVKRFEAVPDGAKLVPTGGDDSIAIVLKDRTPIIRKGLQDSDKPITLSEAPSSEDLFAKALALLGQHAEQLVPTLSRDLSKNSAHEAVVKLWEGKIELGPAVVDMPEDTYRVTLTVIDSTGKKGARLEPFTLRWAREVTATCEVPTLTTGLYQADFQKPNGAITGNQCWILVVDANGYESRKSSFEEISESTVVKKISDDLALRAMLRASLQAVAAQRQSAVSESGSR